VVMEKCDDPIAKAGAGAALYDDTSILEEIVSKMSENKKCLQTARELMDKKYKPASRGFNKILFECEPGATCAKYVSKLPEIREVIDEYAT